MLPSQQPVSLSSLTYERLCILFNVACMYLALGIEEQDKKRAIALYQNSAGVFDYIKSIKVSASDAKEPCSPEFSSHALEAFQQLALGQAQECSFELAVSGLRLSSKHVSVSGSNHRTGHMKDGTVARICQKVSDYHAAAAESATKAQGTEAWPVFMFPSVSGTLRTASYSGSDISPKELSPSPQIKSSIFCWFGSASKVF